MRSFEVDGDFVVDAGAYLWPDAHVSAALHRAGVGDFVSSEIPREQVLRLFVDGEGGRRLAFPFPMRRPSPKLLESVEVSLGVDGAEYEALCGLWGRFSEMADDEVEELRFVPLREGLARLGVEAKLAEALRRNVMLYGTYDPDSASTAECVELCRSRPDRPLAVPVVPGANRGGGVAALVRSLERALQEAAVEVVTGVAVEEVRVRDQRVSGVRCSSGDYDAPAVVCNVPIWQCFELFPVRTFATDFEAEGRAWSVVGGVIAAAFAFRGVPRLRETGEPDHFPGWTRLLTGAEREFGGGMVWTTHHSPDNAPPGCHVLQAMRLSPRHEVGDPARVAGVGEAFERMVREIYLDADDKLLWSRHWTTPDSSEYLVSAARRPPVAAPGVEGLYFVGETTDVPAVQMDAAALSAMRCAESISGAMDEG